MSSADHDARASSHAPADWYPDPTRRFEYRYFNGHSWTADVSLRGQRYVDQLPAASAPTDAAGAVRPTPRPRRGQSIAAFVIGAVGSVLGWIPFIFFLGAIAAVCAVVFGVRGLRESAANDGHGRGFAVAGLVLAPVAAIASVVGFAFTRLVIRELDEFTEPGLHTVSEQQPCTVRDGVLIFEGTITNLDDELRSYTLTIEVAFGADRNDEAVVQTDTVRVDDVPPGAEQEWTYGRAITQSAAVCNVIDVRGPTPFDIEG